MQGLELVEVADSEDPERSSEEGSNFGQFYQGDAYVIKYEYTTSQGEQSLIIVYWIVSLLCHISYVFNNIV